MALMKVGISTASFYPDALTEKAVKLVGELGIKTVEVFLESFSEYNEDFCAMLRDLLQQYDIEVYSVHVLSTQYEPQLFAATERQRKDARDIFVRVLKAAEMLGARVYVFHGPPVRRGARLSLDYVRIGRITNDLAELAGEFGIRFAWENVCWCWYHFPQFASRLLEYCTSQNLYFTLDIKQAVKSGQDPFDFLKEMGNRVANVHVCDFNYRGELFLPGRGEFDFCRLRDELKNVGYEGCIIMEVYRNNYVYYKETKEGIDFLRNIFEF